MRPRGSVKRLNTGVRGMAWCRAIRGVVATCALAAGFLCDTFAQDRNQFFANSYALVIGIDSYGHSKWPALNYAVKDAEGFSKFLRAQGFTVIELLEKKATKAAIASVFEDQLVPKLTDKDRVVVFFAGHGATRAVSDGTERGYLVPSDGTDSYGSLIPVSFLHDMSAAMGAAKHQLFILDSCFGGLAAMRTSVSTIDPRMPNYIFEITRRRARQLLTAGGADQRVRDGGPQGHSYFTGQLLQALNEGVADTNGDGYITFSELSGYIQVAASLYNQTPGTDVLNGHAQGDFLFTNPKYLAKASTGVVDQPSGASAQVVDVYEPLQAGKKAWVSRDYPAARRLFLQAAELGNAEAMVFMAKLLWEGWGGPADQVAGLEWLSKAAQRGNVGAMQSLESIYGTAGPLQNRGEAARWALARKEAERLEASVTIIDPSGQAARAEPAIPSSATAVRLSAPTNLRVQ